MTQPNRHRLVILALVFLLLAPVSPAAGQAQRKPLHPVADISVEFTGVAVGVGVSWGSGVLKFKGKSYPLRVEGLSLGDVGYAKVFARGKVYNLHHAYDISGTYGALGAGVALAEGVAGLTMRNERGVIIDLAATQEGVKLNLGPQGLTIKLK